MSRIFYIIPDLYTKHRFTLRAFARSFKQRKALYYLKRCLFRMSKPVGGVKVSYQHCMLLRELGYDASPVLMGEYHGNFFGFDIEPIRYQDIVNKISPDDIVIATEFAPYQGLLFGAAKKVLFLQNWIGLRRALKPEDKNKDYLQLGYDAVITCSEYCSDYVREHMKIPVETISNGIDLKVFSPKPEKRIVNRILAMSRKNPEDLKTIRTTLAGSDFDLKVVDGLTQEELIGEYRAADIFIATGYPEGFSLPPIEAMACGCVVVGFTGGAGAEFMINGQTALTAADGDCQTLVEHLMTLSGPSEKKEMLRQQGIQKAGRYSLERTKQRLDEYFSHWMTR